MLLPNNVIRKLQLPFILMGGMLLWSLAACKKDDTTSSPSIHIESLVVPLADTLPAIITQPTLLTNAHSWFIKGWMYVSNEATLRVEAGTVIQVLPTNSVGQSGGGIVVTRGSKLVAAGTSAFPVNIYVYGEGGGIVLLGKAPVGGREGVYDRATWISGAKPVYGGMQPADSSGALTNINIHYTPAGTDKDVFPGGILLLGTGTKTVLQQITLMPSTKNDMLSTRKLK